MTPALDKKTIEGILAALSRPDGTRGCFEVAPFGSAGTLRINWLGGARENEMIGLAKTTLRERPHTVAEAAIAEGREGGLGPNMVLERSRQR